MKFNTNLDVYKVETESGTYYVVIDRLRNDVNGNGRAEYTIIPVNEFKDSGSARVYRGYYCRGGRLEAQEAVKRYEQDFL